MHKFNRYFIFILVATLLMVQAGVSVANPEGARDFVKDIGNKVMSIASSGAPDKEKEQNLNNLFRETVDVNWIARFVAGRYWRSATEEQQKEYLALYTKFLTNSYVPKFRQYTDQELVIGRFAQEAEGEYLVETQITEKSGQSYKVDYKIRQDSESSAYKIYDIIAEGVSMITTQRSEFGSILAREGMDGLITKLEERIANPVPAE